jgi:hypothetical protein
LIFLVAPWSIQRNNVNVTSEDKKLNIIEVIFDLKQPRPQCK